MAGTMGNIGALANMKGEAPNIQKVSGDTGFIGEFTGGGFDSVKIFRMGDGFFADTGGEFDFTAETVEELIEKLNNIGVSTFMGGG